MTRYNDQQISGDTSLDEGFESPFHELASYRSKDIDTNLSDNELAAILPEKVAERETGRLQELLASLPKARVTQPVTKSPGENQAPAQPKVGIPSKEAPVPPTTPALLQNLGYGQGISQLDLAQAQQQASQGKSMAAMLSGITGMANAIGASGTGKAAVAPDAAGFEKIGALGEQGVKNIQELRAASDQEIKRQEEDELRNPNSPASIAVREALHQVYPNLKVDNTVSAAKLKSMGINLSTLLSAKMSADSRRDMLKLNKQMKDDYRTKEEDKQTESRAERMLPQYGKNVAEPLQQIDSSYDKINKALGFNIDDAVVDKNDNITINGKKVDLPGMNLPGVGNVSFYSGPGRELQSGIQEILNITIKERSGAAVTPQEMERLKLEFASGKWNKEAEIIRKLQQHKEQVVKAALQAERSYMPRAIEKFKEAGGITAEDFSQKYNKNTFSSDVVTYAKEHNISPEQAQKIKDARKGK